MNPSTEETLKLPTAEELGVVKSLLRFSLMTSELWFGALRITALPQWVRAGS